MFVFLISLLLTPKKKINLWINTITRGYTNKGWTYHVPFVICVSVSTAASSSLNFDTWPQMSFSVGKSSPPEASVWSCLFRRWDIISEIWAGLTENPLWLSAGKSQQSDLRDVQMTCDVQIRHILHTYMMRFNNVDRRQGGKAIYFQNCVNTEWRPRVCQKISHKCQLPFPKDTKEDKSVFLNTEKNCRHSDSSFLLHEQMGLKWEKQQCCVLTPFLSGEHRLWRVRRANRKLSVLSCSSLICNGDGNCCRLARQKQGPLKASDPIHKGKSMTSLFSGNWLSGLHFQSNESPISH